MRVLVVDDELALRDLLTKLLQIEGYVVDTCADGAEALYRIKNWQYNLVLLDVMVPMMNGWEILRAIRNDLRIDVPVLMLTGMNSTQERVRGLDGGADDYLCKPFQQAELLSRVRSVIRRGQKNERNPIVRVGELEIDTNRRVVTQQGRVITLTATEYDLIDLLARHRRRVVSREQLYDQLFEDRSDAVSNSLDVHLHNVRRKIGRDLVRTVRGRGFVIDA